MAGVFFVVCIPTANYEHTLLYGTQSSKVDKNPEDVLQLDVQLRNRNSVQNVVSKIVGQTEVYETVGINTGSKKENEHIPMEKILEELLTKLKVEHVVWCGDKKENYYEVMFPLPSGEPCENCLHCLTELGIGRSLNSVVSVLPCNVVYNSIKDKKCISDKDELTPEENSIWSDFVDSVKSKLTVKQVVDGVQSGGNLTFDFFMLILTAACLAALGLVENEATNIVAAMLVSPLMGPVMSLTFGTIISDRKLQKAGLRNLFFGMIMGLVFGFIFGLILGTTKMPWGFGDWPTAEMKNRGNVRSVWVAILWALPSGTGVALALLQGSAGPLIGAAISASLLPPMVNCGLYWSLSCIWLLRDGIKLPHIKGELLTGKSAYEPLYSNYLPMEFFLNGCISVLITFVNVIFIFLSAIVMLKIKEVAAPYTSTPDIRRFWEKDIKHTRNYNKSFRRTSRKTKRNHNSREETEMMANNEDFGCALDAALREAAEDDTFKKVRRISFANQANDEISQDLLFGSPPTSPKQMNSSSLSELNNLEQQMSSIIASLNNGPSSPINRLHSLSKSFRNNSRRGKRSTQLGLPTIVETGNDNISTESAHYILL